MNDVEKNALAMTRDDSEQAAGVRTRAARNYLHLGQEELGKMVGVRKSTISNCERGKSYPGRELMIYFKRNHRIGFDFFMDGDWLQLPGDVQEKLFPILRDLHDKKGPEAG